MFRSSQNKVYSILHMSFGCELTTGLGYVPCQGWLALLASYTRIAFGASNSLMALWPNFKHWPKYRAFGKSLCTYKRWWKWCPRASIQVWTLLILLGNTFCRSACEMFLTYAVIAVFNSLSLRGRSRHTAAIFRTHGISVWKIFNQ